MLSSLTQVKGWVKQKFYTYGQNPAEVLPPSAINRLQEDDALLSQALCGLSSLYHYPLINTASFTINTTAAPDKFTLDGNTTLVVGGVFQNTANLDTLSFTVPDNSTMFLRAELASDCGDVQCYQSAAGVFSDPMTRNIHLNVYLTAGSEADAAGQGGGPSSPGSMRILKAVKGAAGSNPVITAYANYGFAPGYSMLEHLAASPAHAATAISFSNAIAALSGNPTQAQAALEALAAAVSAHAAASPAHAALKLGFDNTNAVMANAPATIQAALEQLAKQSVYSWAMSSVLASNWTTTTTTMGDVGLSLSVTKKRASNSLLVIAQGHATATTTQSGYQANIQLQLAAYIAAAWAQVGDVISVADVTTATGLSAEQPTAPFMIIHILSSGQLTDQIKLQGNIYTQSNNGIVYQGARLYVLELGQ